MRSSQVPSQLSRPADFPGRCSQIQPAAPTLKAQPRARGAETRPARLAAPALAAARGPSLLFHFLHYRLPPGLFPQPESGILVRFLSQAASWLKASEVWDT